MKILLCIDDTDNIESIGTGELLENICEELENRELASSGFVSRHQLFIHDSIDYTSHNSSMCCELELENNKLGNVIEYTKTYLADTAALGSDPGLCVVIIENLVSKEELVAFGHRAKIEVLRKVDAYELAKRHNGIIYLSEHGGTGDGVIGALAGCGLRLFGRDGRIKGKIKPENPFKIMKVMDFCQEYNINQILNEEYHEINSEDFMICGPEIKAIVWNNKPAVVLAKESEGIAKWRVMSKKELNKKRIGR